MLSKAGRVTAHRPPPAARVGLHDDPAGLSKTRAMRDPVTCSVCGTTVDEPPLTWSMQVSERGQTWLCETCARENLRSIEGKLDEAWW
jgi:hypothetical protein